MKWEFVKYKCRDLSRKISIEKLRERKSRRVELENRVAELENIITTNSSEKVIIVYNNCKSDLEALYNYIKERIINALEIKLVRLWRKIIQVLFAPREMQ